MIWIFRDMWHENWIVSWLIIELYIAYIVFNLLQREHYSRDGSSVLLMPIFGRNRLVLISIIVSPRQESRGKVPYILMMEFFSESKNSFIFKYKEVLLIFAFKDFW